MKDFSHWHPAMNMLLVLTIFRKKKNYVKRYIIYHPNSTQQCPNTNKSEVPRNTTWLQPSESIISSTPKTTKYHFYWHTHIRNQVMRRKISFFFSFFYLIKHPLKLDRYNLKVLVKFFQLVCVCVCA